MNPLKTLPLALETRVTYLHSDFFGAPQGPWLPWMQQSRTFTYLLPTPATFYNKTTFRLMRRLWGPRAHVFSSPTTLEPTRQPHRTRASSGYPQSVYPPILLKFLNRLLATTRTLKSSMEGSATCILARSSDSKTDLLNSLSSQPEPRLPF